MRNKEIKNQQTGSAGSPPVCDDDEQETEHDIADVTIQVVESSEGDEWRPPRHTA